MRYDINMFLVFFNAAFFVFAAWKNNGAAMSFFSLSVILNFLARNK